MEQQKNMYAIRGAFVTTNGTDYWFHETNDGVVGYRMIAGYSGDIEKFGYEELPDEVWAKWYWHGYKVTGAFVHAYSDTPYWEDFTLLLWVNTFNYHPEHDLLPNQPYRFDQTAEEN